MPSQDTSPKFTSDLDKGIGPQGSNTPYQPKGIFGSADPYNPNAENFTYKGAQEGYFQNLAGGARSRRADTRALDEALAATKGYNAQAAAQAQLQAGADMNMRQQMAMAAGGRGGVQGQTAAFNAAMAQGNMANQQVSQQAAVMGQQAKLQQLGLQGQLGGQITQAGLAQTGMNDQFGLGAYGMGQKSSLAQLQANMGYEQLLSENYNAAMGINSKLMAAREGAIIGGAGAMGAGLLKSDPNAKQDIYPISDPTAKRDIYSISSGLESKQDIYSFGGAPAGYSAGSMYGSGGGGGGVQAAPVYLQAANYAGSSGAAPTGASNYGAQQSNAGFSYGIAASEPSQKKDEDAERAETMRSVQDAMQSGYQNIDWGGAPQQYQAPQFVEELSDPRAKRDAYSYSGLETKQSVSALDFAAQQAGEGPADAAARLGSYAYKYKPEFAAREGEDPNSQYVGPMANRTPDSMENNPVYASAVKYDPEGNARVDTGRATMANVAVTSDLARRVKQLEAGGQAQPRQMSTPALEAAVEAQSQNASPAAMGMRAPGPQVQYRQDSRTDQLAPESESFTIPWERAREFEGKETPGDWRTTKIEDPEEPTRFSYRVEHPRRKATVLEGTPSETRQEVLDPSMDPANTALLDRYRVDPYARTRQGGELEDRSSLERTMREDEVIPWAHLTPEGRKQAAQDPSKRQTVEDAIGDYTFDIKASRDPKERKRILRQMSNIYEGGPTRGVRPSAELIHRKLQERGVNVKKSEVVDALRQEFDL